MNSENKNILQIYKKVIETMPYGIVVSNIDGKFIFYNNRASIVFNENLQKSLQENWVEDFGVFTVDRKEKYKTENLPMSKALKGQTVVGEKMYIKHIGIPNGVYLKVSAFPIITENTIEAAVIIFDDITEEQIMYDSIISKINDLENYLRELNQKERQDEK